MKWAKCEAPSPKPKGGPLNVANTTNPTGCRTGRNRIARPPPIPGLQLPLSATVFDCQAAKPPARAAVLSTLNPQLPYAVWLT